MARKPIGVALGATGKRIVSAQVLPLWLQDFRPERPRQMALKCRPPMLACADRFAARVPPKARDSFYITPEFKAWALAVKKRARFRCEGPGCGRAGVRMFADHIVEIKDGGAKFDLANGQCLCGSCHTLKTNEEKAKRLATPFSTEG